MQNNKYALLSGLTVACIAGGIFIFNPFGSNPEVTDPIDELERLSQKLENNRDNKLGLPQKARPIMSRVPASAYKPHSGSNPHLNLSPEKLVTVALQHIRENRFSEALVTLNDGLKRHPNSSKLLGVRGSIHLQQKRITEALSDFESALNISPDDVLLLVNRAQVYRQFQREDQAMNDLEKAVSLSPDFVAARFNRGALLLKQQKFEAAKSDFEHCIGINPHEPAPYFNLAITLNELGQRDRAIEEMQRFLKIAKRESWRNLGEKQLATWKTRKENNSKN